MIRYRRNARSSISPQRATGFEGQIECDDSRNADRHTSNRADETLFTHTTTDEPIESGSNQRRKDDVANHRSVGSWQLAVGSKSSFVFAANCQLPAANCFSHSFKIFASSTSSDSRLRKMAMMM